VGQDQGQDEVTEDIEAYYKPYEKGQEVPGLEELQSPQPCYDCQRLTHHAARIFMGEGYEDAIIPLCCDYCNINLVLG
jgi:hypothetical protein